MILIVDDDTTILTSLRILLSRAGYEVMTAKSPDEALSIVRKQTPEAVMIDMNYSGATSGEEGLELLRKIKIFADDIPVILMSAWGSIPLAVEGMRLGAWDFITKPWNTPLLLSRVATALEMSKKSATATSGDFDRTGIVGESPAIRRLIDTLARVAPTDASVLITGENGTGKELIANAIHRNSRRAAAPFVAVNLGGVPATLFESEMFGHTKGAFTGAVAARKGRFELADKGTIFLDEIGELDPSCQVKMLRVLQEHTFEPLGESRQRSADFRLISATNADLPAMIAAKTFREDLFYRINSFSVQVPSLRERREDIPLLARHFAPKAEFSADAMQLLVSLPYPGNVRQLKSIVERCVIFSDSQVIGRGAVEQASSQSYVAVQTDAGEGHTLEDMEIAAIRKAISRHAGNMTAVALELGITRQALYRRIEKYGL